VAVKMGMDAERIKAIRTRGDRATPGPWKHFGLDSVAGGMVYGGDGTTVADVFYDPDDYRTEPIRRRRTIEAGEANSAFIAYSREDMHDLLDEVQRLGWALRNIAAHNMLYTLDRLMDVQKTAREALEGIDGKADEGSLW